MAELKDVVESILTDLLEARHVANQYSHVISKDYAGKGSLNQFAIPAIDIGNVKVDLKFIVEEIEVPENQRKPVIKRDDIIGAIRRVTPQAINNRSLILKEASATAANKKALEDGLTKIIEENTDKETLIIDEAKANKAAVALLKPHLGKTTNGRNVSPVVMSSVIKRLVSDSTKELQKVKAVAQKIPEKKATLIVDFDKIKNVDSGKVSNLSLDLDLSAMEWHELETE